MTLRPLVTIVITLLLSACASQPNVHYQQADNVHRSHFNTFSIKPIHLKGHNQVIEAKVEQAIRYSLEQQGLSFSKTSSDLEVQYAVGVKKIQNIDLKPINVGSGVYTSHIMRDDRYATLVINIRDNSQKKSIWRMSGSRKIEDEKLSQAEINDKFSKFLENFK